MCRSISKIVLVIVNAVFAVFSLAVLGIGIWVAVYRGRAISKMESAPEDSELKTLANRLQLMSAAIIIIVISVFCLLLTISGCFGAMKENVCMLKFLIVIGLAAVFKGRLQDEVTRVLRKTDRDLFKPYNELGPVNQTDNKDIVSRIMNSIHVSLRCCGVTNYTDITVNSTWSRANPKFDSRPMLIPASCCQLTDDGAKYLAEHDDWSDFKKYLINGSQCPTKLANFHQQGCLSKIVDSWKAHVTSIIVAAVLYIGFNVVCIVMAYCLMKEYSQQRNL
uniref:Tetraspanin n=1 Tax=Macrostomum lignano TaxID=282301 RepID=A0A1I8IPR7_9PLAT